MLVVYCAVIENSFTIYRVQTLWVMDKSPSPSSSQSPATDSDSNAENRPESEGALHFA